jgi:hypothetical protein
MWQSDPDDRTISSVKSGHLKSVICGQRTSVFYSLPAERVIRVLEQVLSWRGLPAGGEPGQWPGTAG